MVCTMRGRHEMCLPCPSCLALPGPAWSCLGRAIPLSTSGSAPISGGGQSSEAVLPCLTPALRGFGDRLSAFCGCRMSRFPFLLGAVLVANIFLGICSSVFKFIGQNKGMLFSCVRRAWVGTFSSRPVLLRQRRARSPPDWGDTSPF